jgi:hypothetical protein
MAVDDLLLEFGRRSGLGALSRNRDGVCRLVFDGGLVVDIEAQDQEPDLHITASIGAIAPDASAGVLRALLAANLMGKESGGAALALDLTRDEIVLHQQLPLDDLSFAAFERTLQTFLNHIERCRGLLDEAAATASATASVGERDLETRIRI